MIRPLPRYSACLNPQRKLHQLKTLKARLKNTDPFELSRHIDQQLEGLYKLAAQRNGAAREKAPLRQLRPNLELHKHKTRSLPGSAWRDWTFSKKLKRQQYEKQRQVRTTTFGQIL